MSVSQLKSKPEQSMIYRLCFKELPTNNRSTLGHQWIPATNYDTFADAVLKKLITEIAAGDHDVIRSSASDSTPPLMSQTGPTFRPGSVNSVMSMFVKPR